MRARGFAVHAPALGEECARGNFIAPTLIEIEAVSDLRREVFGPVLHVLRYPRRQLTQLIDDINASGYALTGGVHWRIEGTIDQVVERLAAGNVYVNRNIIGAVVGVQPFGGHSLSGTGPKAGGPLYLKRLLCVAPALWPAIGEPVAAPIATRFCEWLAGSGREALRAFLLGFSLKGGPSVNVLILSAARFGGGEIWPRVCLMKGQRVTITPPAAGGTASLRAIGCRQPPRQ